MTSADEHGERDAGETTAARLTLEMGSKNSLGRPQSEFVVAS
jgi:hypothetical protein